ncbi:hypothetical protein FOCC_FOCC011977 [Frankliniella occidentalis]|nr:hypothetical protein FOCC_FOCC011977 [Frankliniella occidentalis]
MALYLVLGCPALLLLGAFLLRRWPTPPPALRRHLPDVYLEGNVGAGKSTLATALASTGNYDVYQEPMDEWRGTGGCKSTLATALSSTGRYSVYQEPVAEWRNLEGFNFLRQLQVDYGKYVFLFQVVVLATLARRLRFARPSRKQRIFERSSRCALDVFCRAADERGFLAAEEYIALRALYEATAPTPPVVYLYIRTPPDMAQERTQQRGRAEENALPRRYFEMLHRLMDDWLLRNEANAVYVLDGTLAPGQVLDAAMEILDRVAHDF